MCRNDEPQGSPPESMRWMHPSPIDGGKITRPRIAHATAADRPLLSAVIPPFSSKNSENEQGGSFSEIYIEYMRPKYRVIGSKYQDYNG